MSLYPGMKPNIPNQESFVSELGLASFSEGSWPSPSPPPDASAPRPCTEGMWMQIEAGMWINAVTFERCCDAADGVEEQINVSVLRHRSGSSCSYLTCGS